MATGRLKSTLIPPYGSAEVYNNNSGYPASITLHSQVLSSTEESNVSVALTTTDYSSTVYVGTSVTTTSVSPYNCLMNVVYCYGVASENYLGYYAQVGGGVTTTGHRPSFVACNGEVFSKAGATCYITSPIISVCNGGVRSTAVNPELLMCCFPKTPLAVVEATCVCLFGWPKRVVTNPCLRAKHFASSCCFTGACAGYDVDPVYNCCVSFAAVDMYSDLQVGFSFGGSFASNLHTTAFVWSSAGCCFCARSNQTNSCGWVCCAGAPIGACVNNSRFGPVVFAGCGVLGFQCNCGCASFKGYDAAATSGWSLCTNALCALAIRIACTPGAGGGGPTCIAAPAITVCWDDGAGTQANSIRWMGYNPSHNCNYFMIYSNSTSDGIYAIDHAALVACTESGINGVCNTWCGLLGSNPIFTKVSAVPNDFLDIAANVFCPSRLFHSEYCRWFLSVNDGSTWQNFVSCDLINWCNLCKYSCCYLQVTQCFNTFTSTGSGITRNCNCYFSVVPCDSTLEYETSANQYVQTGLVVSNGDRIYFNNNGKCSTSVSVWGYEG